MGKNDKNREGKHKGKSTPSLYHDFNRHLVFPVGMAAEHCLSFSHGFLLICALAELVVQDYIEKYSFPHSKTSNNNHNKNMKNVNGRTQTKFGK